MQSGSLLHLRQDHLAGCGMHVDSVMSQFPVSEQCACRETQNAAPTTPTWSFSFPRQGR